VINNDDVGLVFKQEVEANYLLYVYNEDAYLELKNLNNISNIGMTEQEIKHIGFELVKQYEHDQFKTNRYQKGILKVEFTYEKEKLVTVDLTIEEVNCLPITKNELQQLNKIFN